MSEHQALLWLPDAMRAAGLPFIELKGWEENEPNYYWVDPSGHHHGYNGQPNGWVWHHTASKGYTPYVKNRLGQTKANLWMGLWSPSTPSALWSFRGSLGSYQPMVMIASSGPADYSNGSGRIDVLTDHVAVDVQFNGPQHQADTPGFYGNRYYGGTEVVHPGDGTPLDDDVWELQANVAALMSEHWGWSVWRHIAHQDHTVRKIDQRFAQGAPYTIAAQQQLVLEKLVKEEDETMLPLSFGDGYDNGTEVERHDGSTVVAANEKKRSDVRAIQGMLQAAGATVNIDGRYGLQTRAALLAVSPATAADSDGYVFHGNDWTPVLLKAVAGSPGTVQPHTHSVSGTAS